jgi:hypothetical protein
MWNNIISFNIFFKEIEKITLEKSHKGKKQTLYEDPTRNVIQSLSRSKNEKFLLIFFPNMFIFMFFPF